MTDDDSPELPLFAVAAPGLEALVAGELQALGIRGETVTGGVVWRGQRERLYEACLRLRTASRVLLRLGRFRACAFWELEKAVRRLPWRGVLAPGRQVALRVTCRRSRLYHQGAISERFLRWLEEDAGARGTPAADDEDGAGGRGKAAQDDEDGADEGAEAQLLVVRFERDECTVSADACGAHLHRRGYRRAVAKAPLRETLAAAVVLASGWDRRSAFLDPFCGAGTLAIEAALLAREIPPGLAGAERRPRPYAFQRWPGHDEELWQEVVRRAAAAIRPSSAATILASDRDAGAVASAAGNAERAGVSADVRVSRLALSAIEAPPGPGWLVSNPPYGRRVGEADALRDLYAALGRVARERLPDWTLALLSADPRLEGQVGVRWREALRTVNGGVPVRLVVGEVR